MQNISLHINNIFKEGELNSSSTVKEYLTVQMEGTKRLKNWVLGGSKFNVQGYKKIGNSGI